MLGFFYGFLFSRTPPGRLIYIYIYILRTPKGFFSDGISSLLKKKVRRSGDFFIGEFIGKIGDL